MNYPLVIATSLASTAFFAFATAFKHRSAGQTPQLHRFNARHLGSFVAATATHPLWLAGLLCDAGGLGLQVLALHIGALAVVQPLLITALLFSIIVNHRVAGTRITALELRWGVVLVLALAGFLAVSGAASPTTAAQAQAVDKAPAAFAAAIAVVLAGACVAIARRTTAGVSAALIGVATGTTYAGTAALIKYCTDRFVRSPVSLLASWQLYALLVAGAAGLVLSQLAFQSGPLTASLPAIATVDPLLSIVLGVVVYDEQLRAGWSAALGEATTLLLMSTAAVYLSRVQGATEAGSGAG